MKSKNLRLLGAEHSPLWQPSMEEMIAELKTEIDRGELVYTREELIHLERKLADYEQMLANLLSH